MQPNWLPTHLTRWGYRVVIGLLIGLLCLSVALLAGLILGLSSIKQPTGLIVGLIAGLIIGLVSGLISGLHTEIKPAERVTWSWKKALWGYGGTGLVVGWPLILLGSMVSIRSPSHPPSPPPSSSFSILVSLVSLVLLPFLIGLINGLRVKIKPFRVAWLWKRVLWGYGGCWLVFVWLVFLPLLLSLLSLVLLLLPLLIGLISGLLIKIKPFRVAWSWKRALWGGLVVVCFPALFTALLGGPLAGLFFGLSGNTLEEHIFIRPNGGTWRSARNSIRYGAIVGITLLGVLLIAVLLTMQNQQGIISWHEWQIIGEGLIPHLLLTLPFALPIIVIIVLIIGLIAGGMACIQHITLRVFLQRAKSIPWNYPQFLDYAAERILLRKVGGGYIFFHRLLLDYFATRETGPDSEASRESMQERVAPSATPSVAVEPVGADEHFEEPTVQLAPRSATVLTEAPRLLPCGHERRPHAHFCSVCGAPVTS